MVVRTPSAALGEKFIYLKLVFLGAYAEYVAVSTHMLIHKPAQLSWEQAAGIPEVSFERLMGSGLFWWKLTHLIDLAHCCKSYVYYWRVHAW